MSNFRVPCYDDLTPPIPDVSLADVFDVARVLTPLRHSSISNPTRHSSINNPTRHSSISNPTRHSSINNPTRHSSINNPTRHSAIDDPNPRSAIGNPQWFACLRSTRAPETLLPIATDFSPRIQRRGDAAVVLDVSGLGRLLGDAPAIAAELQRAARERSGAVHVSIAPTQAAALLLACAAARGTAPGPVVAPAAADALAPLPLAVLRQIVVEAYGGADGRHDRAFDVLRMWGLATIGEFAALPAADLSARMGQGGLALQAIARGIDPAPLVPDPGVPRFVQSIELEWPIEQLEALSFVLPRLLDPLSLALERADRGAAAIRVDLRLADRTTHARVLELPAAMRDPRVLRTLVLLDLESHPPGAGIDVVTIEVDPAPARIVQYSLLERARPSAETVATLTARLHALVGESRCGTPVLLDSHRPDGFELRRFTGTGGSIVDRRLSIVDRRSPDCRLAINDRRIGDRRGNRRLTTDDPIDDRPSAIDDPVIDARRSTLDDPCLRRFRPPVAIRVAVERGRPSAVAIDRRGMPGGRVARAAGPWRTSGAWWNGGAHWDRDEWDVEVAEGAVCRIFHDRVSAQWFMEGVID